MAEGTTPKTEPTNYLILRRVDGTSKRLEEVGQQRGHGPFAAMQHAITTYNLDVPEGGLKLVAVPVFNWSEDEWASETPPPVLRRKGQPAQVETLPGTDDEPAIGSPHQDDDPEAA